MGKQNNISIGNCGEYFVAAELERRGFSVAVPMSNTPTFDLLAIQRSDLNHQISIQVKTNSENKNDWTLNAKNENLIGGSIFYVFVKLNGLEPPEFFIVPSKVVAESIRESHHQWLEKPGKDGQKHNDNPMRRFSLPENTDFKNAWHILQK